MAEPKGMISMTKQPLGWPTHRYQHCLKTVMPSKSIGTNMRLHRNVPKELLPSATPGKLPGRWRVRMLPAIGHHNPWHPVEEKPPNFERTREKDASQSRVPYYDVRPPSAYSESIIMKPAGARSDWIKNRKLHTAKLHALMRDNTFHPGNFSTLYRCSREQMDDMVNRLSYDPYERREQLVLADNPEGAADTPLYSKADIDAIVERLAAMKAAPALSPEPEKKPTSKELSPKEQEIVDRLSKYEHPADKVVAEDTTEKKTITEAEVKEMLKRLTQKHERKLPPVQQQQESKKVSAVDMDNILTRLTTYDSTKWPPESKPEIFKQHTTE